MSRFPIQEGETPLLCKCHGKAVMATYGQDGAITIMREWHGENHMLVLTSQQVLDIIGKTVQNLRQAHT